MKKGSCLSKEATELETSNDMAPKSSEKRRGTRGRKNDINYAERIPTINEERKVYNYYEIIYSFIFDSNCHDIFHLCMCI